MMKSINYRQMGKWANRLIGLFCVLCLMACFAASVEGRGVGTSGSAALKIGIGARATGMGDASVAVVDDVSSIYWNPAGLFLFWPRTRPWSAGPRHGPVPRNSSE